MVSVQVRYIFSINERDYDIVSVKVYNTQEAT